MNDRMDAFVARGKAAHYKARAADAEVNLSIAEYGRDRYEKKALEYHERAEAAEAKLRDECIAAWDEGHATALGYDISYHLDREEWLSIEKDDNPYRQETPDDE